MSIYSIFVKIKFIKMKKTLVLICLAFAFLSHAGSQDLRFSFLASPQIVWLQGGDANFETKGSLLGLNTGIELDFFFDDKYAFTTGLTINSLGGGVSYSDSIYLSSGENEILLEPMDIIDYRLQYIAIPVGLKFKSVEIGYTTIWLNTGINSMFNIKSKGNSESGSFNKSDLKDEIGSLNFNYFIEGGIEYSLGGNTALIGGIGYNSGIMDVTNRPSEKLTTQSFSLILGILF